MGDLITKRITIDAGSIEREAALLRAVFPTAPQYSPEYLRWQYAENPDGAVVGFDAYDGNTLAAHYATQPLVANVFGKTVRGLLSFNTATHPDYQGRGLFTRLASETYECAKSEGYEFVVGVANANSSPGFVRKLGFQLVAQLDARVGVGTIAYRSAPDLQFERVWSAQAAAWRIANPARGYCRVNGSLLADTGTAGIAAILTKRAMFQAAGASAGFRLAHPARAWVGLHPDASWRGASLPVPKRLRPSPLNLIYLDLTGAGKVLDAAAVFFETVDFDAY